MKLINRTFIVPLAFVATSPLVAWAQEEHGEGGAPAPGLFDINPGLSVWTLIVFGLVLLTLHRFAWGPILGAVNAREEGIQSDLDQAKSEREEAASLLAEHKKQMSEARREAQQIIQNGKTAGEKLRQEIEAKARTEGHAMIERAREEIQRERDAALDTLRKESVDLALAAASKLIRANLDADRNRELVMGYVDELSKSGEGAQA
ncbi:MAG: F0F1 ATP synthase subunit B [Gemmatimonadota bacterium]|nr:MAG: F0F1 ATP synthase subunit B [Gemmatimonadota bacterium]